ncbi:MAG: ribosome biogenesis GTPase Der [Verrucomicrobiales bacterium]
MPAHPPTIAIVGRPNVGKSALFNRLAGRRIAIVHDQPGVTRDRLFAPCGVTRRAAQLVDTGGIGATLDDGFADQVRAEAEVAIETADLILLTVDGQEGLHPIDETLASELRRARVPVAVVVNKIDDPKHDLLPDEFSRLGFPSLLAVSAAHGRGFGELVDWLDASLEALPETEAEPVDPDAKEPIKLAIVGRPNVGKSSLLNALLGKQRAIVSDVAGTTRDAIDVPLEHRGHSYLLIDTAGLRPRAKRDTSVEVFSAMRTEQSIRRADLVALVVDSAQGITAMDRKIAAKILEANKPCIIVLNKYDLFHPGGPTKERIEELTDQVSRDLFFISYAPFAAVSAKEKQHLGKFFQTIEKVRQAATIDIPTGPLNRLLQDGMVRTPPPLIANKRFKLLYVTSATAKDGSLLPVPTFLLFINRVELLTETYKRYLENLVRTEYGLTGLPIRFVLKPRRKDEK